MNIARDLAAVAVAVAATLALTGCSSKDSSSKDARTVPDPVASSLGPGAASDLTQKSCKADKDGAWTLGATIRNPTDQKSTYTLTVSVVQTVGSTVVASKDVTKVVEPRATVDVKAPKVLTTKGSAGLSCVVSVRAKRA